MADDCVFCQIVAGSLPAHRVWESKTHLAFLSIFPNTEGVTVVIPKHHCTSYIFNQSDQVMNELMIATKQVATILDNYFTDVGRCGMFFEGFGVNHLHSKLFPMHGTKDLSTWQPIESKLDTFFDVYPGYLSSHDSVRADDQQLSKLAAQIRASYSLPDQV